MSWHSRDRKRRGYHHGNLREALVAAALDLIGEKGPAGFTFAEAARSAGVSPAAPYRHFRDRDALMAEVARQGFERFGAFLANAWSDGAPDPVTALDNLGKAYLAFARSEPAYYAAMFEAQVPPDATPELAEAAEQAFLVDPHRAAGDIIETRADGSISCTPNPAISRTERFERMRDWHLAHQRRRERLAEAHRPTAKESA